MTLLLSSLLLSSLELSDTKVYGPQIRARLGTASRFCEVAVLKPRTVPNGATLSSKIGRTMTWTRMAIAGSGPDSIGSVLSRTMC